MFSSSSTACVKSLKYSTVNAPIDFSPRYISFPLNFIKCKRLRSCRSGVRNEFRCSYSSDDLATIPITTTTTTAPSVVRKRKRYRKEYPGENKGIVEEMRFVAMKLRDDKNNRNNEGETSEEDNSNSANEDSWEPSIDGFLKYLVDSKLVFETLDRIIDESSHVAYAYFRKTGLERTQSISKDLEWFDQQNFTIPQPSSPGLTYSQYLKEVSDKNAPSFLCHFYNIYFAHIAGGQVIGKQVSEKLINGRELEFYKWDGDVQVLLKDMRENLNKLGEHWSRDEKNKCLREAAKSFKFSGQIIRLIIL